MPRRATPQVSLEAFAVVGQRIFCLFALEEISQYSFTHNQTKGVTDHG